MKNRKFQHRLEAVYDESSVLNFIQEAFWFKDQREGEFSQQALCGAGYVLLNYRDRIKDLYDAYFDESILPSEESQEAETGR
jgi:hypothetical protein